MELNDHCTPATAKRLRDAGLKQPPPAPGQVWYDKFGNLILMIGYDNFTALVLGSDGVHYGGQISQVLTYAATSTYILRSLEYNCGLFPASDGLWLCMETDTENLFYHANPAEACSEAWFAEQNQP